MRKSGAVIPTRRATVPVLKRRVIDRGPILHVTTQAYVGQGRCFGFVTRSSADSRGQTRGSHNPALLWEATPLKFWSDARARAASGHSGAADRGRVEPRRPQEHAP